MNIRGKISAAIFGALCAPFLFSCAQKTPAEKAAEEKILLAGNAADPASLDPSLSTGFNEYKILSAIFEGLVCAHTRTLEILPAAAKSWEISEDGRVYVFRIDENAKWSDGSKVTAQDFVFAWRRTLNPKLGAEYASMLFAVKNARKINAGKADPLSLGARAVSDSELRVELEEPTPYFLSLLYHPSYFPLPRKTLEKFGAVKSRDAIWTRPQNIISNGPFTLSKWSINDRVSVRKNPLYRDAANVMLNGVDFIPISNVNTEDRAFRAGQLHVTDSVAPSRIAGIIENSSNVLRRSDWLGVYYYIVNTNVAPFDNPKVRRALAMSIDRRAIIDSFLKAGQKPALTFVPAGCDGYAPESRAAVEENVARARELLAEAGYPEGRGFPNFRLCYNTSEQHKPIAEAVQQMWKKNLGVNAELFNLSWPAYLAARRSRDFEVARASWIGDFAAPESFLQIFASTSGLNHSGFESPEFDALLAKAAKSSSKTERLKILAEAERVMLDASPVIPVYFYSRVYLLSPLVSRWDENILDYRNFKNVEFTKGAK